jgi:hypothetical protein
MRKRDIFATALLALVPTAVIAAEGSLRGSPQSMTRQHAIALEEDRSFFRTPGAVLEEVAEGGLTPLDGNADYRTANVSFPYAAPEVRLLVERVAKEYRATCGEQLVVTSLTRPTARQPRNAHALSVHPAGIAVDLRISQKATCRTWLERTLLALENQEVLDVTRERHPPHYHVAVFPTQYRALVDSLDAMARAKAIAEAPKPVQAVAVTHAKMAALPPRSATDASWLAPLLFLAMSAATGLGAITRRLRQR